MPLDLRLKPSRGTYASPWRDLDSALMDWLPPQASPLQPRSDAGDAALRAALDVPTQAIAGPRSARAPGSAPSLPVLHSALGPERQAGQAAHRFTACLERSDCLLVPAGVCWQGDYAAASVLVQGWVQGCVRATQGPLVIARGGRVEGGVEAAGPLVIAGDVRAAADMPAVVAHGLLQLAHTARVRGETHFREIAIYAGAKVAGRLLWASREGAGG